MTGSGDGEAIGLYNPAQELIDAITFGLQAEGISEGRLPDGATKPRRLRAAGHSPGSGGIPGGREGFYRVYEIEEPAGLAKRFIDFSIGPEGQAVVAEVGYIPLWER